MDVRACPYARGSTWSRVELRKWLKLLWELKKAQKVATYTTLAKQAGFSAGMNGRTMATTIRTIRRDWPHLEWWRAVSDDGVLEKDSEHEEKLRQSGYELEEAKGKRGRW